MTIVESLNEAREQLAARRERTKHAHAAREYSIAITAVEDAIMRTNRGCAIDLNVFREADVESGKIHALAAREAARDDPGG